MTEQPSASEAGRAPEWGPGQDRDGDADRDPSGSEPGTTGIPLRHPRAEEAPPAEGGTAGGARSPLAARSAGGAVPQAQNGLGGKGV